MDFEPPEFQNDPQTSDKKSPRARKTTSRESLQDILAQRRLVNLLDVRGHTSFKRTASRKRLATALIFDALLIGLVFLLVLNLLRWSLLPNFSNLSLFIILSVLYFIPQQYYRKTTLGQFLFHMKPEGGRILEKETISPMDWAVSLTPTFGVFFSILAVLVSTVPGNPIWISAQEVTLETFHAEGKNWSVQPFFYAMGAWPKEFEGDPIFYKLFYEKGPPSRFVGHVIAEWSAPEVKLVMEGPKTPNLKKTRTQIKDCFLSQLSLSMSSLECANLKDAVLQRHLAEMGSVAPQSWEMQWFTINHEELFPEEKPQGIHLVASGKRVTQERYVFINRAGVHQAVVFFRPSDPDNPKFELGEIARNLVEQTVRTIRNGTALDSSREWIDQRLTEIQLDSLPKDELKKNLHHLAEVQGLLISRISVSPASFPSYYHLAGTSLMLINQISQEFEKSQNQLPYASHAISVATTNLESALDYAEDIEPDSKETLKIKEYWEKAQEKL